MPLIKGRELNQTASIDKAGYPTIFTYILILRTLVK